MKKLIVGITCVAALLAHTLPTIADETKEQVTITGEAKCAKCTLKEGAKCQNVIQAKEEGKTVSYYLAKNDVSTQFNENLCKEAKKVTATGTVKTVEGKKELTASKIELAKN